MNEEKGWTVVANATACNEVSHDAFVCWCENLANELGQHDSFASRSCVCEHLCSLIDRAVEAEATAREYPFGSPHSDSDWIRRMALVVKQFKNVYNDDLNRVREAMQITINNI